MTVEKILAKELAEKINERDTWDYDLLTELCELAGLKEEWENCDPDDAETVAYKAAKILEVEI